jgi:hypothetical protein
VRTAATKNILLGTEIERFWVIFLLVTSRSKMRYWEGGQQVIVDGWRERCDVRPTTNNPQKCSDARFDRTKRPTHRAPHFSFPEETV